jgi:hypothetical protein
LNLYAYVGNNPVSFIDPYGLDPLDTLHNWLGGPWTGYGSDITTPENFGAAAEGITTGSGIGSGLAGLGRIGKAVDAALPNCPQALKNKATGDAFRDEIADLLRKAGRDATTEVPKNTPFGRRVIDIEVSKDGKVLSGVETKTGNSRYTPAQQSKDEWLRMNGYPVDVVRKP